MRSSTSKNPLVRVPVFLSLFSCRKGFFGEFILGTQNIMKCNNIYCPVIRIYYSTDISDSYKLINKKSLPFLLHSSFWSVSVHCFRSLGWRRPIKHFVSVCSLPHLWQFYLFVSLSVVEVNISQLYEVFLNIFAFFRIKAHRVITDFCSQQ